MFKCECCNKCSQEYALREGYKFIIATFIVSPMLISSKLISKIGGYTIAIYLIWCVVIAITMLLFYRYKKV